MSKRKASIKAKRCCPCACHRSEKAQWQEIHALMKLELDERLKDPEFIDAAICGLIEKLGGTLAAGGLDEMQELVLLRLMAANRRVGQVRAAMLDFVGDEWRVADDGSGRAASVATILQRFTALGVEQSRTEKTVIDLIRLDIQSRQMAMTFSDLRRASPEPDWTRWWEVPLDRSDWHKHKEAHAARKKLGFAYEAMPYDANRQTGRYLLGSTPRAAVVLMYPLTPLPIRLMDYPLFDRTFPDIAKQLRKESRRKAKKAAKQQEVEQEPLGPKQTQSPEGGAAAHGSTETIGSMPGGSGDAKKSKGKSDGPENGPADAMFDGAFDKSRGKGQRVTKLGSGRWAADYFARHHIEQCLEITIKMLREHGLVGGSERCAEKQGEFRCSNPRTGEAVNIPYRWRHLEGDQPELVLDYERDMPEDGVCRSNKVHRLIAADKPRGGVDWYFECPVSANSRVRSLYLPAFALEFGTKGEHNLDYASKYLKRTKPEREHAMAA